MAFKKDGFLVAEVVFGELNESAKI